MDLMDDGFWAFVETLSNDDGGGFKCKFCGQMFAATTSITRLKWHWSGIEGHGVRSCAGVITDIQRAAFRAIQQPPNRKRKKNVPSSSNTINEFIHHAISNSPQRQINEFGNLMDDPECLQMEPAVMGEERAPSHAPAAGNHLGIITVGMTQPIDTSFYPSRLTVDAPELRGDAQQATDQVSQLHTEKIDWQVIASIAQLMEVEVENVFGGLVQPDAGTSYSGGLPCNMSHETRTDALPTSTTELVGQAFEKNKNVIWSWLMNDEVCGISIYGMGGVGKTTLVKHISTQLSEQRDTLSHVYWVTVSRDFNINELQNRIARCVDLDLSKEDDELQRAVKLSEKLEEKQKWILVLDDLWNSFDPEKVGIPVQQKGCKLILTSRSLKVCREMGCVHKIKLEPLSLEEAWILFRKKLMHDVVLSPEAMQIAKSVTRECAGLPLALVAIARSMRGVDDLNEWRCTLKKLKESKVRDIEDDVFRLLKFSYDRLNDLALQQCLLYCALFPEDYKINRGCLISYLIDEGIIKEMSSRQEQFDEGHMMLNKLENVCLLERCEGIGDRFAVKMHDLIRDMALQIQQENCQVIVKAGQWLEEVPDVKDWKESLVRVSLMQNCINDIPLSHSPCCPNLSTLLLHHSLGLQFIPDGFFKQLYGLKVLDLSDTYFKILPNSIFYLGSLTALLLKNCLNLRHVPSLKELKALKRLDLGGTILEDMPQDMELLSNLKYLRLGECGQKEFPTRILPKLSYLQVFELDNYSRTWVKGNEVACLRKLETLKCHFEHPSDLAEYLDSRDKTQSLSSYSISVGECREFDGDDMIEEYSPRSKTVGFGSISFCRDRDFQLLFPNDMEKLRIIECHDATSLCGISSSIKNATKLEVIEIRECHGMDSLLSSSCFCSAPLEPSPSHCIFSHLKQFHCYGCDSMKKLFPLVLLPNLVNLEVIEVENCGNLEEIIATTDEVADMGEECSSGSYSITESSLPKLRFLTLIDLPELKSICTAKLKCDSLECLVVWNCLKLTRMPFSLSPSLDEISCTPDEWWDSVEWDHPKAKDVLDPSLDCI